MHKSCGVNLDLRVLDLVQVLHTLGHIDDNVRASSIWTEAPNLAGFGDVPIEIIRENARADLEIVARIDLASLDRVGDLIAKWGSGSEDTVVLVLRFGERSHRRLRPDGLAISDYGVRLFERDTGVVLFEILDEVVSMVIMEQRAETNLQANLEVELTSTSDDVFTRLVDPCLDAGVGLGQALETFDELGEIGRVLDLDGDLNDRRDGELHDLHVVRCLGGGEGTVLQEELVDTDETDDVAGRAVLDGLDITTHHENGTLHRLDEKILLLAWDVVRALDADLGTGLDGTSKDTTEGVETALIGGRDHFRDIEYERTVGIAVTDGDGGLVVHRALVEGLNTIPLCRLGRRQVDDNHLKEGVTSGQELAHDDLEKSLALEVTLLLCELDVELVEDRRDLVLLEVHDGVEDLEDGIQDERVEGTLNGLAVSVNVLGRPLLGCRVEEVVTPELGHHLLLVDTELLGVACSKLAEGEGPAVETRAEGDGTLLGVDLDITKGGIVVCSDNDVDGLDGTQEGLVKLLLCDLELEKRAINLVDDDDGLDALGKSLAQDGLGLDADTFNTIDDNESTIGDTKCGRDLGREIDVSRAVDEVDEELGTWRVAG